MLQTRAEDRGCVFLGPRGCTVHPDRPLACRIYPLARWVAPDGDESFGHLEPHPQTAGIYGTKGTVDDYLTSQGLPPYFAMGEALAGYMQAVGIKTRIKAMERAAMTTAWREKKLKNVIVGITGAGGNAATRLEAYVSRNGIYTSGILPDVEDLFQRQARETDVKKREALVHQIQQILHDRVTHVPIYELAFTWGIGPRLEEPGISLIRGYAYSAPYEDLKLKKP